MCSLPLNSGTVVLSLPILKETSGFRPGGTLAPGTGFYRSRKRTCPGGGALLYCMVTGRYRMRPCRPLQPSPPTSVPSQSLELSPPGQPQEQGPDFLLDPGPFSSLLSQNVLASEPAKHPFPFLMRSARVSCGFPSLALPQHLAPGCHLYDDSCPGRKGHLLQGRNGMGEVEGMERHILCSVPQLREEPFRSPGWWQRT